MANNPGPISSNNEQSKPVTITSKFIRRKDNTNNTRNTGSNTGNNGRTRNRNTGPITNTGNNTTNTNEPETGNPEVFGENNEQITLVYDDSVTVPKRRGRKPGSTNKKKLSPSLALAAGKRAANKICDLVSLVATFTLKTPVASMKQEERENISEPLGNILSRLPYIEQIDTGSDAISLIIASGVYGYRLYVLYQFSRNPEMVQALDKMVKMMNSETTSENGVEPPIDLGAFSDIMSGMVSNE